MQKVKTRPIQKEWKTWVLNLIKSANANAMLTEVKLNTYVDEKFPYMVPEATITVLSVAVLNHHQVHYSLFKLYFPFTTNLFWLSMVRQHFSLVRCNCSKLQNHKVFL